MTIEFQAPVIYPWQQAQWQNLQQRFKADALPHALLLTGPVGMGQLNFAMAIAAQLLCEKNNEFHCAECKNCQLFHAHTHPDLFLVKPEVEGKLIKIDTIRQLVDALNKTAQQGGYQVVIIEPADAMNIAAANALLKTLEEPAGKVLIILISAASNTLPATIRSRCQQIHFHATQSSEIMNWLQQQNFADVDLITTLARAESAPLLALKFAEPELAKFQQDWLYAIVMIAAQQQDPCQVAAQYINSDLEALLNLLQQFIYDLIRLQYGLSSQYVQQTMLQVLQQSSRHLQLTRLMSLLDEINTVKFWLSRHLNLNQQLVLETLLIKLSSGTISAPIFVRDAKI